MSYTITDIDNSTGAISVEFTHKGHKLNHTSFITEKIDDADEITRIVERDYAAYKHEVENKPVDDAEPKLEKTVENLIGKQVEPTEPPKPLEVADKEEASSED